VTLFDKPTLSMSCTLLTYVEEFAKNPDRKDHDFPSVRRFGIFCYILNFTTVFL